jgi:hypothetical protein
MRSWQTRSATQPTSEWPFGSKRIDTMERFTCGAGSRDGFVLAIVNVVGGGGESRLVTC